ncbi:hypothetical protein [Haloarchaeobius baliensis]|uniref:hypothetical protein n=1 Tax=Haloarchaeobius baliensis TaxID=1670458 RepID=UPI003F8805F8
MVEDRVTDGVRIAQLLSSELDGREDGTFARFAVVDADRDVAPTVDGALAYRVTCDGEAVAEVFVQPDRTRVELRTGLDAAVERAEALATAADGTVDLRVRPKAVEPPRVVLFVESGAAVKRAADVLVAAVEAES